MSQYDTPFIDVTLPLLRDDDNAVPVELNAADYAGNVDGSTSVFVEFRADRTAASPDSSVVFADGNQGNDWINNIIVMYFAPADIVAVETDHHWRLRYTKSGLTKTILQGYVSMKE